MAPEKGDEMTETTTPAKATPRKTTARKPPAANGKAPAAKANGAAPAKANGNGSAPANGHAAGFAGYLTKPVADQMPKFRKYIERETGKSLAELAADPDRLVQMISKGYRYFAASDLNGK